MRACVCTPNFAVIRTCAITHGNDAANKRRRHNANGYLRIACDRMTRLLRNTAYIQRVAYRSVSIFAYECSTLCVHHMFSPPFLSFFPPPSSSSSCIYNSRKAICAAGVYVHMYTSLYTTISFRVTRRLFLFPFPLPPVPRRPRFHLPGIT